MAEGNCRLHPPATFFPSDGVGVDKARFKSPVVPGDQVHLEVEVIKNRREIWVFSATAKVDGKMVASAEIMCTARNL